MSKVDLSSRRRIATAIRMVLRAEAEEEDAAAAEDLVELLEQWESGVVHGRTPPSETTGHHPENQDIAYG